MNIDDVVDKLVDKYDVVAKDVYLKDWGYFDAVAMRKNSNGITVNLYGSKVHAGAIDFLGEQTNIPYFLREMIVSWTGHNFRMNVIDIYNNKRVVSRKWTSPGISDQIYGGPKR